MVGAPLQRLRFALNHTTGKTTVEYTRLSGNDPDQITNNLLAESEAIAEKVIKHNLKDVILAGLPTLGKRRQR